MRDVGENGFLCYIKTTKSIKTAVVSVDSEGKSQIVYTDEKKPKFPCYFLKTTDGKTEMKFGNEEYICAAVYLRYMYQNLPNGLYIVRISQETLEIVDFINPTIDERKL